MLACAFSPQAAAFRGALPRGSGTGLLLKRGRASRRSVRQRAIQAAAAAQVALPATAITAAGAAPPAMLLLLAGAAAAWATWTIFRFTR